MQTIGSSATEQPVSAEPGRAMPYMDEHEATPVQGDQSLAPQLLEYAIAAIFSALQIRWEALTSTTSIALAAPGKSKSRRMRPTARE
jgi:hypothetical protein